MLALTKKCPHTLIDSECRHCRKLYDSWNKKLEREGVDDAEKTLKNGERVLKQNAENSYRSIHETIRQAKERYFQLLSGFVQREKFRSLLHKYVLMRVSDGASIVSISCELKRMGEVSTYRSIRYIVRKYELKWKIKKWAPKELRQKTYQKKSFGILTP